MNNFWEIINEDIYNKGGKSFVTRARTEKKYTSLTDEQYEEVEDRLARQAYANIDTGLTKEENYYLISECIGVEQANEFLTKC